MLFAKEQILAIHAELIRRHGGSYGVRDMNGLESAIARPNQTFDGKDLYQTVFEKAGAIGESIIKNHPFIDGNKRTGYVLMEIVLRLSGYKIIASDDKLYNFIIEISTDKIAFQQITEWLIENTTQV